MGEMYLAQMRCLRDFRVALLEGDLDLREGQIITIQLREAVLLQKYGLGKIISVMQTE